MAMQAEYVSHRTGRSTGMRKGAGHRLALHLALTTALAGFLAVHPVIAQPAAAQSDSIAFDIPPQQLNRALVAYSAATGSQLLFDASIARGKTAPGVRGTLTRAQALQQLLAGSGLSYSINGGTVRITGPGGLSAAEEVPGAVNLDTISVSGGAGNPADAPYEQPGSYAYISGAEIERFRGTSVGDFLTGIPGVMNADGRNSGALDVNIRGMQGQGRVPVVVDGATQETTVYQGYNGSTSRTYVDPDFIGAITIEKGPSAGADATGATGGVVRMSTINASDILLPGRSFGVRVRGGFNTNSTPVPATGTTGGFNGRGIPSYDGTLPPAYEYFGMNGLDRPPFLKPTGGSGSLAAAYSNEFVDIVAGYAQRKNGNYFAGSNGSGSAFATLERDQYGTDRVANGGITPYRKGEEVLNTSIDNESWLAKVKIKFDEGHNLELGYMNYQSEYGHMLGSQAFLIPSQYQGQLSSIDLDTYTARYKWNPQDNDLINVKIDSFFAKVDNRINSTGLNPATGRVTPVYFWVGSERWGITASNTSLFDFGAGPMSLQYGAAYTREDVGLPDGVVYDSKTMWQEPREGYRKESSGFSTLEWKPWNWLTLSGNARYSNFETMDNSSTITEPFQRTDGGWSTIGTVTVEPVEGAQIYTKVGSVLRSPSIFESLTGPSFGIPVDLNPVDPERARSIEVGTNLLKNDVFMAGDKLRFHAAYFDNHISDYITRSNTLRDFGFMKLYVLGRINLDYAEMRGFEATASYDTGKYYGTLSWNGYTHVMFCAKPGTIDPLWDLCNAGGVYNSFSVQQVPPKDTVTLDIGGRFLEDKLTVGSRISYVGNRFVQGSGWGGNTMNTLLGIGGLEPSVWNPYTLVDLYATYKFNDQASLDVGIDNLTDRFYVDALNAVPVPAPGRTFRSNLTLKF
ncbi:TonB-dependent receptor domain-containing protein [Xanthobacteraceae bacterium A53D]